MMVRQWMKDFLESAGSVFATKQVHKHAKDDAFYGETDG
jgi:hypothetical protein